MTYFQFIHAVETKVKKEVEEEKTVSIHTNVKNNGVRRSGIMISEKGINISPTIYLEEYFHQFRMGYPLEQIAKDIVGLYEKIRFQNSWEDGEKVKDYEFVKDKIIYRLIGREENQELLKEIPYKSYLDLAIIYYVLLEVDEYGMASMMVRAEHMDMWKVTEEDLYYRASKNTQELLPYEFAPMRTVIEELLGLGMEEGPAEKMYILSNEMRSYGAAALIYPDCLRKIAGVVGENFFVIPSSVHELLLVSAEDVWRAQEMTEMIRCVNQTGVAPEEILSDHKLITDFMKNRNPEGAKNAMKVHIIHAIERLGLDNK